MNEIVGLMLVLSAGILLGLFFFGGLWWTVHRSISSKQPALWFFSSLLLRVSVVMSGFYFITGNNWYRLLLCLIGFIVARLAVMRFTRSMPRPVFRTKEASRAA
jgi:F1F0 ATPase subunit 2